jgi:hypothetical protein
MIDRVVGAFLEGKSSIVRATLQRGVELGVDPPRDVDTIADYEELRRQAPDPPPDVENE